MKDVRLLTEPFNPGSLVGPMSLAAEPSWLGPNRCPSTWVWS